MIVHMLRDNATGLYYRRSHSGDGGGWVKQERGSIWPTTGGTGAALGHCRKYAERIRKPDTFQIVDFTLSEIKP
jgi:hypothetical protein